MKTFTVRGSHGTLTVDAKTGAVIREDSEYITSDYSDIARFDLAEWQRFYPHEQIAGQNIDILDLGYYTASGVYETPAHEWREELREARRA